MKDPNVQKEWAIIDAVFKDHNEVVAVETHEETEYLHKEHGEYDSLSLDNSGNVKITRHPAKFSTSKTVSEGAIDSRPITCIDTTYTQKDVIKMLLASHNNSLVTSLEGMKQKEAKKPCLNAESHLFGQCFECVKTKGWNKAITESQELIKNSLT